MRKLKELEQRYPYESKIIQQKLQQMHENVEPGAMNSRINVRNHVVQS